MADEFASRMARYAAAGGAALLALPTAEAAVRYYDLDPDHTYRDQAWTVAVDLNLDFTPDLELFVSIYGAYGAVYARPLNGGALIGSGTPYCLPARMTAGTVGPLANFGCGGKDFLNSASYMGEWIGGGAEGYLGIRFKIGDTTHYGWVHLVAVDQHGFTLTEWAWEDQPDTAIGVGDVPVELQSFTVE